MFWYSLYNWSNLTDLWKKNTSITLFFFRQSVLCLSLQTVSFIYIPQTGWGFPSQSSLHYKRVFFRYPTLLPMKCFCYRQHLGQKWSINLNHLKVTYWRTERNTSACTLSEFWTFFELFFCQRSSCSVSV